MKRTFRTSAVLCVGFLVAAGSMAASNPYVSSTINSAPTPTREIRDIALNPTQSPPLSGGVRLPSIVTTTGPLMVTSYNVNVGWFESSRSESTGGALTMMRGGGSVYSPKQVADRQIKRLIRRLQ